jgi:hypothetical protein
LHRKTGSAGKSISGRESERSQASPTERILEHQQDKKAMIPERITKGMEQQMANHPGGIIVYLTTAEKWSSRTVKPWAFHRILN